MIRSCLSGCALVVALVASPSLHADVFVVGDASLPDVDFDLIGSAIAAAASGDTILVRGGSAYIAFTVDGKSLVITADTGADVLMIGAVQVRNLGPAQTVVIRGISTQAVASGVGLRVEDCAGPVWIEDCGFFEPYATQDQVHGIEVTDCAFVSLVRCTSEGSRAIVDSVPGAHGLQVVNSNVAVYDSAFRGGTGLAGLGSTADAGAGVQVDDGSLFVSGGSILGGDGGLGIGPFGCQDGGDGATALVLTGNAPSVRVVDAVLQGGAAGLTTPPCTDGVAGADTDVLAGTLDLTPWTTRSVAIDSPLRSGDTLTAQLAGEPGDIVWAMLSPAYTPLSIPAQPGSPLIGGPLLPDLGTGQIIVVGALDGNGALQIQVPVPPLPVTFTRYLQCLVFSTGTAGEISLSSGTAVTFLDDSQ